MAGEDKGSGARNHSLVVSQILARCGARPDCRLWSNATGLGRGLTTDNVIKFGLKGSSDILGIYLGGILLAVEVKTGTGRQSLEQRAFEAMVTRFGGRYKGVGSAEEVTEWLDGMKDW